MPGPRSLPGVYIPYLRSLLGGMGMVGPRSLLRGQGEWVYHRGWYTRGLEVIPEGVGIQEGVGVHLSLFTKILMPLANPGE